MNAIEQKREDTLYLSGCVRSRDDEIPTKKGKNDNMVKAQDRARTMAKQCFYVRLFCRRSLYGFNPILCNSMYLHEHDTV